MANKKKLAFLSRPKDRSMKAFQAWMNEIADRMGVEKDGISDEKWVELHKKFWDKSDAIEKAKSKEDDKKSS